MESKTDKFYVPTNVLDVPTDLITTKNGGGATAPWSPLDTLRNAVTFDLISETKTRETSSLFSSLSWFDIQI